MTSRIFLVALLGLALALPASAADKPGESTGQDLVFLTDARPVRVRLHIEAKGKPIEQAWQAFIKHVFTTLDTDKNGTLDAKEAVRIPAPQSLFNSVPYAISLGADASAANLKVDANNDGKVTEQELADFYSANGGPVFGIGGGNRGFIRAPSTAGDRSTSRLNARLFELLDTNRDGKLSVQELSAAPQVLNKFDADDDEMITAEETLGDVRGNTNSEDGFDVVTYMGGPSGPQDHPFFTVPRRGSLDATIKKLLTRYAGKESGVKRAQLGIDEATFRRFDLNEDGKLEAKELDNYLRGGADLEVKVRLGEPNVVELLSKPEAVKALKAEVNVSKASIVEFKLGTNQFTLQCGSGEQGIQFGIDIKEIWKTQFTEADKDNNNYLDANEAKGSPVFAGSFKRFDRDGDGMLYLKEVLAAVAETEELSQKASQVCASLDVSDSGQGLFELLDLNGDSRLSVRELRQAAQLLKALDTDKDSNLARTEVPRSFALNLKRGPIGGGAVGGIIAFTTFGSSVERQAPKKLTGPVWFHKMDRNTDGDVSRREFLGTDAQFKAIDSDGDGLISEAEAKVARPEK